MIKGQKAGSGPISIDVEKGKNYAWCACGKSKSQPFCDGSHKGSEFNPVIYKAEENKKMFFAFANKLIVNHFAMVHIANNN